MILQKVGKKTIIAICVVIAAAVYFVGSSGDDMTYLTQKISRGDITKSVTATGEVRASKLVLVGALVSGQIEEIYVKVGDRVKKGELLAQIDSTAQQNELDTNIAKEKSYAAQLEAAHVSLEVASLKFERTKQLSHSNAISKEALENAKNEYESARAKLLEIEMLLSQAKIAVNNARKNLNDTKIISPLDGVVVSVPITQGQSVNSLMNTPTIVQIADLDEVEILMEISESDITKIKSGMKVRFSVFSEFEMMYETKLASIDPGPTLLTNNEYSGVVKANEAIYYYGRLIVANTDAKLRIGMTTQNAIEIEKAADVLMAPSAAIKQKNGQKYITVLKEGKLYEKEVVTGIFDNVYTQIKSGVSEGDEAVISYMSAKEIAQKEKEIPEGLDL
ncbi:MAG: efflux RND transporter periplasmic adaptor subunit [Campylobacteraceae bacterium]|jgi:macrolide-specific efflux system membrane fusion protein|nr:efflux RND transporter periplasmic adaptor subunit [Campylobacteraceae bacterium]